MEAKGTHWKLFIFHKIWPPVWLAVGWEEEGREEAYIL